MACYKCYNHKNTYQGEKLHVISANTCSQAIFVESKKCVDLYGGVLAGRQEEGEEDFIPIFFPPKPGLPSDATEK